MHFQRSPKVIVEYVARKVIKLLTAGRIQRIKERNQFLITSQHPVKALIIIRIKKNYSVLIVERTMTLLKNALRELKLNHQ
jgi:hypothetical protein